MPKGKQKADRAMKRVLDARPDTLDFRDRMFEPTLAEVPVRIDLVDYKKWRVPILDQGREGACTGFGLATVVHYLLRRRRVVPDATKVSTRMLYEMAKRYDEWPGERYEGSSARGAMKGWHKHGVCADAVWPYQLRKSDPRLTDPRVVDAARRPLGAYFRVNHKDLVAMHVALAEVGILYATATVHDGWNHIDGDGVIPLRERILGGHAFAIVAFDERGFWIQNSWTDTWGVGGFALITYDDWLSHASDVWVARLGAPVTLRTADATATTNSAAAHQSQAYAFRELRPHIISIGNDGRLRTDGTYGTSEQDVDLILNEDFPRITKHWSKKRLLLYAHGGLVSEASAIQRLADYREALLAAEVYPLSFIWKSDVWTTLTNILEDALRRRRPEGFLDDAKDFMLDRLDDALEPLARHLTGKAQWDEMKENATWASANVKGGARIAADRVAELVAKNPALDIHVVGHSAGSIFHAPLIQLLTAKNGHGLKVASCILWAPACTIDLFKETYLPAIRNRGIGRFALFTLTDRAERDDHCANIYHKSLLYLVSHAFEARVRIPLLQPDGTPLLGMEKFAGKDADLQALFRTRNAEWIKAPNVAPDGSTDHSTARHHGDFDDDQPTLRATLARIRNATREQDTFTIHRSASSFQAKRQLLVPR